MFFMDYGMELVNKRNSMLKISCKNFVFELKIQKQPSRDVPRKSVLKICGKATGEHPC